MYRDRNFAPSPFPNVTDILIAITDVTDIASNGIFIVDCYKVVQKKLISLWVDWKF